MGHKVQRFGIRIGRGWAVLFLLAGAGVVAAYWIGPLRPMPARLQLLAVSGDAAVEEIAGEMRRTADGAIVYAVPLAARNIGAKAARPRRVHISVPAHFRLATMRGRLQGVVTPGLPLRRYAIELPAPVLEPGTDTQLLAGLDTIYIEPDLPRYYCSTQGLRIPEFAPAPKYDAQMLSSVRIFYSFTDAEGPARHTGLLTVTLDPARLNVTPAAMPPTFDTSIEEPEARAPDVGALAYAGARRAHCGDPEQPVELHTVLWETRAGGRVFVIYVDKIGRKRLYDLNRDGIIELETWDGDADGRFEARREARYAVPDFLLPLPPRDPAMIAPDPVPPDSAWLALFHRPDGGPRRFARSRLTAHPQPVIEVAILDSVAAPIDSVARPAGAPARTADELGPVRPADPQFLALFADTDAGPFRFSRRQQQPVSPAPGPARAGRTPSATDTAGTPAAQPAEEDTLAEPAPRPVRRRAPLGTPIIPPRQDG